MPWILAVLGACGIVQTPPAAPEPRSLAPALAACGAAPATGVPALSGGAPHGASHVFEPRWVSKAPVAGRSLRGVNPFVLPVPADATEIGQPSDLRAMYALGRNNDLKEADAWVVCLAPKLGGFVFSGGEAMVVVPGTSDTLAAMRAHVTPDERVSRVKAPHWCAETTAGSPGRGGPPSVVSVLSFGVFGRSRGGSSSCGPDDVSWLLVEEGDLASMDCVVVSDSDVQDRGARALAQAKAKVEAVCTSPIRPDEPLARERITSEDWDLGRDAGLFLGWNEDTVSTANRLQAVWAEDEAWAASIVQDDLAALPPLGTPVLLSPDLVAQVTSQWEHGEGLRRRWVLRFETHSLIPAVDQNAIFVDIRNWVGGLALVYADGHQQLLSLESQSSGGHRLWVTAQAEVQSSHGAPQFINFYDGSHRVCGRARVRRDPD